MKRSSLKTISAALSVSMLLSLASCSNVDSSSPTKKSKKNRDDKQEEKIEEIEDSSKGTTSTAAYLTSEDMTTGESALPSESEDPNGQNGADNGSLYPGADCIEAKFLGVQNYGAAETKKENAEQFQYRFDVNGQEVAYKIDNSERDSTGHPAYPVQNRLKEGYSFKLYIKDNLIVGVEPIANPTVPSYTPVVSGKPGEKTVLNFLKTAMGPVGTTLYVFGGGWDWQDTGSAIQSRTLGVAGDWVKFFNEHDGSYTFKDKDGDESKRDPKTSYYPFGGFNEYYYAGLDCSGFVGWTVYNTFETENEKPGYVVTSTKMAKRLHDDFAWGEYTQTLSASNIRPGDVISVSGHVWIALGACDDGSIVIVHSTSGYKSKSGQPGGGVAIGAIGSNKNCEAYQLASSYMTKYYPKWMERYDLTLSDPGYYLKITGDTAGKFSWDVNAANGLSDPEGVQQMKPAEVLKLIFGE